ncbi:MAG: NAD(+) synthase [Pelotomaculum sp.]|jgi:NAD+ synthase (glutamine-hydrolysing)
MRVALGQMEIVPGRPDINCATMLEMSKEAREQGAQMIIFPEMAIPGYLLGDTWEYEAYLKDCEEYGRRIVEASSSGLCILFGNVGIDWHKTGEDGRVRKYNAFYVAQNGHLCGEENFPYPFRIKKLQHNCRGIDDTRHFYSLRQLSMETGVNIRELSQPVTIMFEEQPFRLGCILGDDSWSDEYVIEQMAEINSNGPVDLFVHISSSPFAIGKNGKGKRLLAEQVKELKAPLIYVNNVGVQNNGKTIYAFDGKSLIYNRDGAIMDFCSPFTQELKVVDLARANKPVHLEPAPVARDEDMKAVYEALHYGISKFLQAINVNKVVIGLSGGIDSAVAACLYTKVMGPENVYLVNMPSVYSSQTTKGLAARLAQNLGCMYTIIPIQEAVDHTYNQITGTPFKALYDGSEGKITVSSFVLENIQARDRSARVLAGIAAAVGGVFTCNGNKSEMTVGYATLYGDLAGYMAALGDLWKHQIYELAEYINEQVFKEQVIPQEIIDLVPCAELSSEQNVEQGQGDPLVYPYHDYLFKAFVEHRVTPEEILNWYAEGCLEEKLGCRPGLVNTLFPNPKTFIEDLERWWKLYTGMGVAKRIQAPPILAVSRRAYGSDHREAQNGTHYTAGYLRLKKQLLSMQDE